MRRKSIIVMLLLVLLISSTLSQADIQQEKDQSEVQGDETVNPFFAPLLELLENLTYEDREVLLSALELMIKEMINGTIVVSENMKITNITRTSEGLKFELWYFNNTNPIKIRYYEWKNPEKALHTIERLKTDGNITDSEIKELSKDLQVVPLSIPYSVVIKDIDYLTNDGNGEYVILYNPSSSSANIPGWYIMDSFAYNNNECWNYDGTPKDSCEYYGREHIIRVYGTIAPFGTYIVKVASSPEDAILNNDGDTVYLVDSLGNVISTYHYSSSPEITVEDIYYYPSKPSPGTPVDFTIKLDNRGALGGAGTLQLVIDGEILKSESVYVEKYSIKYFRFYDAWTAEPGTHVVVAKFIPSYSGGKESTEITWISVPTVSITSVNYPSPVIEGRDIKFDVLVNNPASEKVDVTLKLLVDNEQKWSFSGYVLPEQSYQFYLIWKDPTPGTHNVTIELWEDSELRDTWKKTIYVKPNLPPKITNITIPEEAYSGYRFDGTVTVYDEESDEVYVRVYVNDEYKFTIGPIASEETASYYYYPVINNCTEELRFMFVPVDERGNVGTPEERTVLVKLDTDFDGWCDIEEIEKYKTDPYKWDTDGDGIKDSKDVDPLTRNLTLTVYVFRARVLDPVDEWLSADYQKADMTLEIEANLGHGNIVWQSFTISDNQDDAEKSIILTNDTLVNMELQQIAKFTVDIPEYFEFIWIYFKLFDRDTLSSWDMLDISPESGTDEEDKMAKVMFSVKSGTWGFHDYPNDHRVYFGYGHLSGCGDGSCGDLDSSTDIEPFVKYYDELEAMGYDLSIVNITDARGWDGIESVEVKDYQKGKLYQYSKPEEAVLFTLALPNGTERKVLVINKRNAKVQVQNLPSEDVKVLSTDSEASNGNITVKQNATARKRVRYEAVFVFKEQNEDAKEREIQALSDSETESTPTALTFDALATSEDSDEDDAEIWFLIKLNDADGDGIPFYKELELNKELEERGYSERFNPKENDMYGDYDGDGVPNSVELFIGKDPAKPDVLGIKLTVAVGFNANQTYLTQLIKGFQRASQVVYDYTDGYAMITEISIKNNVQVGSEEWESYMVRVKPESNDTLLTYHGFWYWKWVKNLPGKEGGYVLLFREFGDKTPDEYYRGIAHELGHFVFGIGDEYITHTCRYIIESREWECISYDNMTAELSKRDINFIQLPTIMNKAEKFSELSIPHNYQWFNQQLYELQNTLIQIYTDYGWDVNSWENFTTAHWEIKFQINSQGVTHTSAWEMVFDILSKDYLVSFNGVQNINAGLELDLDFNNTRDERLPFDYIPRTGPYTGVGYYLRVLYQEGSQ